MTERFVVGIDLGTTNTVVAYAPIDERAIRVFPIPQWVSASESEALELLRREAPVLIQLQMTGQQ